MSVRDISLHTAGANRPPTRITLLVDSSIVSPSAKTAFPPPPALTRGRGTAQRNAVVVEMRRQSAGQRSTLNSLSWDLHDDLGKVACERGCWIWKTGSDDVRNLPASPAGNAAALGKVGYVCVWNGNEHA